MPWRRLAAYMNAHMRNDRAHVHVLACVRVWVCVCVCVCVFGCVGLRVCRLVGV